MRVRVLGTCARAALPPTAALVCHVRGTTTSRRRPPPPPPLPGSRLRVPPPPPLGGRGLPGSPGTVPGTSSVTGAGLALPWKAPHEVLSALVEYVPTFHVAVPAVAAILPEETRAHLGGRGRLVNFLRRYPFFFDLRVLDGGARVDVRLRDDVSHPQRGVADGKFVMVDVGEVTSYVAKPEYIVSTDSIELASQSVNVLPPSAPPAVRVQLEERVPVLERLCALIPSTFAPIAALEEEMPEDLLFHPYFDCQGGLSSIAGKFPQHFQIVDGAVRLRPPHLAPLALNEFTLETSPLPSVAARVQQAIGTSNVPHWVSLTSLYEQLTREEKREIKAGFKSFAGFLRAHGRWLSISQDMLHVALWIPPSQGPAASSPSTAGATTTRTATTSDPQSSLSSSPPPRGGPAVASPTTPTVSSGPNSPRVVHGYTQVQILNELFDRFPPGRTLNLTEALALLPRDMAAASIPRRVLGWLAAHPQYFTVEDPTEADPARARLRRASERQPLDIALAIYVTAERVGAGGGEVAAAEVLAALPERQRRVVEGMGWDTVVGVLPEWLSVRYVPGPAGVEGDGGAAAGVAHIQCLRSLAALEAAIRAGESKRSP